MVVPRRGRGLGEDMAAAERLGQGKVTTGTSVCLVVKRLRGGHGTRPAGTGHTAQRMERPLKRPLGGERRAWAGNQP